MFPGLRCLVRPRPACAAAVLAGVLAVPLSGVPARAATIYVEGACTLVKAIHAANMDTSDGDCIAGSGSDVIELSGDVTLTTVDNDHLGDGPNGLPLIASAMTIEGNGWAIEKAAGAVNLRIFQLVIGGNLTLRRVSIRNGRIPVSAAQPLGGGGILNDGILTLEDSTVSGCQVVGDGAAAQGGGIWNSGTLVVAGSTISLNGVTSTTHLAFGGGILAGPSASSTITNSTISGNYAVSTVDQAQGGGLRFSSQSTALVWNVTFSGNSASGATSDSGAALFAFDTTTVQWSIMGNSPISQNCGVTIPPLTDGGNNQSDDGSCGAGFDTLNGLDPVLRDNGGPTKTHALLDGSSAILGASACGLAKDQRGAPRGVFCDAGAFEYGGCPELVLSDDTVLAAEAFEECQISVGPNYAVVGPFGDLTLRAGREIVLGDGFSVGLDAGASLETDPNLIP